MGSTALYFIQGNTFGHITVDEGAFLPEHQHPHEQWTHLIEGEMEFTIGGETQVLVPGVTAYVSCNMPHSGKAIKQCRVIDCFYPVREDFVAWDKSQVTLT